MMVCMYVYHVSLEGSTKQLLHGQTYSVMETIAITICRKLSGHDLIAHGNNIPYITTKSVGPITNCVRNFHHAVHNRNTQLYEACL